MLFTHFFNLSRHHFGAQSVTVLGESQFFSFLFLVSHSVIFFGFFPEAFTTLIFARLIGGIMGGNISTATAVVADVTTSKNRSKGMAINWNRICFWFYFRPCHGWVVFFNQTG